MHFNLKILLCCFEAFLLALYWCCLLTDVLTPSSLGWPVNLIIFVYFFQLINLDAK